MDRRFRRRQLGGLVGTTPDNREFPPSPTTTRLQVAAQRRQTPGSLAGSSNQWRTKMFASESCSKVGCFLEAALPVIAPAVALVWMLSIAAFSCWAM